MVPESQTSRAETAPADSGFGALLLHSVLENVPVGILAVSSTGRILACNGTAEFLLRIKRAKIIDQEYSAVLPDHICAAMRRQLDLLAAGDEAEDSEIDCEISANHSLKIGINTATLFDPNGESLGCSFIFRDMSLSREVQTLRSANEMKSELVRVVSHELKSPLTAILQAAEYLLDEPERLEKDQLAMASIVNESGLWINGLIADLLDLSILEGNQLGLDLEIANLNALVEDIVELHRTKPNIAFELDLTQNLPDLRFDRKKIHQVLENFVSNAVKYSPSGGRVRIRTEQKSGNKITVAVHDQGLGIPSDQLPYVWDKFFRVDSKETAKIKGTGLGLAITKRIVELHGGNVDVESQLGVSSVFSFTLPLNLSEPVT